MSRFLRTISEVFILIIIASKKEVHPYEVYQELLNEIFQSNNSRIDNFSKMLKLSKRYLDFIQDPSKTNEKLLNAEFDDLLPEGKSINITTILNKVLSKTPIQKLESLINDADTKIETDKKELKIWDSKTAIYQVMNELEREGLIKVARNEIYKGRSRKIYSITDKGKKLVLNSIIIYGDLFQKIFQHITLFSEPQHITSMDHSNEINFFFELILSSDEILSTLKDDIDSPLKQLLIEIFPLFSDKSTLSNLISVKKLDYNLLNIDKIPVKYRSFYIEIVLRKLYETKDYIENKIKEFENIEL